MVLLMKSFTMKFYPSAESTLGVEISFPFLEVMQQAMLGKTANKVKD